MDTKFGITNVNITMITPTITTRSTHGYIIAFYGYYTCTYHLITREPNTLPEFGITREFFAMLEKTISRQPEYYLWSHDHWKRTHEEFDRRFQVVNGKVMKVAVLTKEKSQNRNEDNSQP